MNASIMPIIEAKSFDLAPFYIRPIESDMPTPGYLDESALYLDEGYIGGQTQEYV